MRVARRDQLYSTHSRFNTPALTVQPGEIFQVETELCSGAWLERPTDHFELEKIQGVNPAVVIAVAGAQPGACLAVEILDIKPERLGYTGYIYPKNPLARQILGYDLERNTKTVVIEDGHILWSEQLRLPLAPMIGTLGTAPAQE